MIPREWRMLSLTVLVAVIAGAGASVVTQHFLGQPAQIRAYLLSHPEVLPEAMQVLQDREMAKAVEANRQAIFTPFGNAWSGNPKGDVTLVEYLDYNCGYCRASLPMLDALMKADPNLKIVYREMPVLSPESHDAALMSLAAADQGKFKPFHDAIYSYGRLSPETIARAAKVAGVDIAKAAAMAPLAEAEIDTNMKVAREIRLTGTPTWVVGDKVSSGALPFEAMQKLIAEARAK